MTERLEEIDKFKSFIDSLDDSADADDFHKFIDTCQINYEEGTFNEILRFMKSQAERVQELQLEVNDWRDEAIKWNKRFEESEVSHSETKELLHSTISENKRLKQALEFYADEDNYKLEHFDPNLDDYMSTVDYDEEKTARNALERNKNG